MALVGVRERNAAIPVGLETELERERLDAFGRVGQNHRETHARVKRVLDERHHLGFRRCAVGGHAEQHLAGEPIAGERRR